MRRNDKGPFYVAFERGACVGLITLAGMELELGRLLGRRVDMHTIKGLNPRFGHDVLEGTGASVFVTFFWHCARSHDITVIQE
ncbi:MAG: hypothetical protein R6V12_00405 [Candidatus Hydrogenedentota bacterium]